MDLAAEGIGGLADQRLCADGAAVDARDDVFILELPEVAADRHAGRLRERDELRHHDALLLPERFEDELLPFACFHGLPPEICSFRD